MYPSNTLQICYRHIVDVHEEFAEKIIFHKFTAFLTYTIFDHCSY